MTVKIEGHLTQGHRIAARAGNRNGTGNPGNNLSLQGRLRCMHPALQRHDRTRTGHRPSNAPRSYLRARNQSAELLNTGLRNSMPPPGILPHINDESVRCRLAVSCGRGDLERTTSASLRAPAARRVSRSAAPGPPPRQCRPYRGSRRARRAGQYRVPSRYRQGGPGARPSISSIVANSRGGNGGIFGHITMLPGPG